MPNFYKRGIPNNFYGFAGFVNSSFSNIPNKTNFVTYLQNVETIQFRISNPTEPVPPTNIKTKLNTNYITVYWKQPNNDGGKPIIGYHIIDIFSGLTIQNIPPNETSFNVYNLIPGKKYLFKVSAINVVGKSKYSSNQNEITYITNPLPPTNIKVFFINKKKTKQHKSIYRIQIYFDKPTNDGGTPINNYLITDNHGNSYSAKKNVYTITNFKANKEYVYSIKAINEFNKISLSSINSDNLNIPFINPTSPYDVRATLNTNNSITLSWKAPMNDGGVFINSYKITNNYGNIYIYNNNNNDNDNNEQIINYTITELNHNTKYFFTVTATNNNNYISKPSIYSNEIITN
jgi:hypothetical protein